MTKKLTDEQVAKICELAEAGKPPDQLAWQFNVSRSTIDYHMLRNGVDRGTASLPYQGVRRYRRGGRWVYRFTPEEDAFILAKTQEGLTPYVIGKLLRPRRHNHCVIARLMTLARREERAATASAEPIRTAKPVHRRAADPAIARAPSL